MLSDRALTVWLVALGCLALYSLAMTAGYAAYVSQGHAFGGDYIVYWSRASALWHGHGAALIYDTAPIRAALAAPGADISIPLFPYPPHMLWLLLPFGAFSYNVSVGVWLGLTFAAYLVVIYRSPFFPAEHSRTWRAAFFLLPIITPFVLSNIITGQNGFLMAALAILGFTLLRAHPVAAGICFGLLTVKPQLCAMALFALLAGKYYRSLAAALITAAIMAIAITLWLGMGIWVEYLAYSRAFMELVQELPGFLRALNASLYRALILAGMSAPLAGAMQLAFASAALWNLWKAWRSQAYDFPTRCALVVTATFIASPHIMVYDLALGIVPVLLFLAHVRQQRATMLEQAALVALLVAIPLTYTWPGIPYVFIAMILTQLALIQHRS